jgi:hypothetical protein
MFAEPHRCGVSGFSVGRLRNTKLSIVFEVEITTTNLKIYK